MRLSRIAMGLLAAALCLGGCYFTRSPSRPIPALAFLREAPARQPCLVVFLPGLLDGPQTFVDHDFPTLLQRSGLACDSVAVDLHVRYYSREVADLVREDVLVPAVARGYEQIWLVGISLGGLGAVRVAQEHPELVDGVLLLSPFLGDPAFVSRVEAEGGLAAWRPSREADPAPDQLDEVALWRFLQALVTAQSAGDASSSRDSDLPTLLVGWAEGERLEAGARLLAEGLPERQRLVVPGGHDWATWRRLFPQLLRSVDLAPPARP